MARHILSKNKRKFAIKFIDQIFFNRYKILDAVIEAKKIQAKSIGVSSVYRQNLSSSKNFFSDPTADSVIKSLEPVKIIIAVLRNIDNDIESKIV